MIYNIKDDKKIALFEEFMREQDIEFITSKYSYHQVLRSQIELLIEEVKKREKD